MKEVNLISLVQANDNLCDGLLDRYLKNIKISMKKGEFNDLQLLTERFQNENLNSHFLNNFFIGFTIPQISKEFDLLKFGKNFILNIELKSSASEEKVLKQLIENKYYLSFLNKDIYSFSYISSNNKLYKLDSEDTLEEASFSDLIKLLESQIAEKIDDIYSLFNPSNYLISPFNSTEEFINDCYFLTNQQKEVKKETIENIKDDSVNFVSIIGNSGTGKTLLTYDIAKTVYSPHKQVLIVHCGILNNGHFSLINDYSWNIIPVKNLGNENLNKYSLVIVDETQRIYISQINRLIDNIKKANITCIFSYDQNQCLQKAEINNNVGNLIYETTDSKYYKLTKKIRTNKEIANFIQCLFEKDRKFEKIKSSNIELNYFKEYEDAKDYISYLKQKDWKVINYTPSRKYSLPYDNFALYNEDTAHRIVGQEFDNVVAVVDSHFYYDNNKLSTRGYSHNPYYHPAKMLFQIMTRARRKINLVVIDNEEIMERCLSIIDSNHIKNPDLIPS